MSERELPSVVRRRELIMQFPVNDHFQIGIFQGALSKFDILIKYKQLINGKGTQPRTPKHIHWAVDMLIKHYSEPHETDLLLDSLLNLWEQTVPLESKAEQDELLSPDKLLADANDEAAKYGQLAGKGEYSVKFLILIAKLLMVQEKTNRHDAYMFKNLLERLKEHRNIFEIVSTATFH